MLPLRSFFVALLFVLIPAIANKLAAAPGQTHYFGDHQRRSIDGSLRLDPYTDLSASPAYRARPHERVMQPYAATYDGVPLMAPIWTGVHGGGGWGSIETSLGDADISGALFGAHLGFLVRSGAVAAGLELDADYSMLHHAARLSDTAVLMADVNWVVSARARLGVVAGPAFFYATGGYATGGVAMIDGSARVEVTGGGYGQ